MTTIFLKPSEIRFCQNDIKSHFGNGCALVDVFEDLLYERITTDDLPPIHVVYIFGAYYAVQGNRRLRIYKTLERLDQLSEVLVVEKEVVPHLFEQKYTTTNEGRWVTCVDNDNLQEDLSNVIQEWLYDCNEEIMMIDNLDGNSDKRYITNENNNDLNYEYVATDENCDAITSEFGCETSHTCDKRHIQLDDNINDSFGDLCYDERNIVCGEGSIDSCQDRKIVVSNSLDKGVNESFEESQTFIVANNLHRSDSINFDDENIINDNVLEIDPQTSSVSFKVLI